MPKALPRLGVNIDHIATIRNARGGEHPDPVAGAWAAIQAGADGITAHLREDRRHIRDDDMERLQALCDSENIPLNMDCLLYTSPSPRDATLSRMPSSA